MLNEIANIRLKDFEIFNEVTRVHSIREVARRVGSTPGQVSKVIQNIEKLLKIKLFKRSASGVLLTNEGKELQDITQDLLAHAERVEQLVSEKQKSRFTNVLTIAGTSFINTHFTSSVLSRLSESIEGRTFRFLDMPPDQLVALGLRGSFELAIHYNALSWPSTWTTQKIGSSKWLLCARTGHPLNERPSLKHVLEYPFVVPAYWTAEGLVRGHDQFPVPFSKRKLGHETATADTAVPILLATDHVAFLPDLLVQSYIKPKRLKIISPRDVPVVEKELYISVKSDSVPSTLFQNLTKAFSHYLASQGTGFK